MKNMEPNVTMIARRRIAEAALCAGARTVLMMIAIVSGLATAQASNADSVAVIIGNQNYQPRTHDVAYAHNDAIAMREFLTRKLGYRNENIIFVKDGTLGRIIEIFGDEADPKGELWNWVRPERSNVFVYYSGHGAPTVDKETFLIPTDIDPERAHRGFSLRTLQRNLSRIKERIGADRSVILMLEACFSGQSAGGNLMSISAGIRPRLPKVQSGIIRLSAATSTQVANWDHDRKQGLFTAQFLDAINGAADSAVSGDKDGTVTWNEMTAYLTEEVRYRSTRTYSRTQEPQFEGRAGSEWRFEARESEADILARACDTEPARFRSLSSRSDLEELKQSLPTFTCPAVRQRVVKLVARLERNKSIEAELAAERRRLSKERAKLEEARRKLQDERSADLEEDANEQDFASLTPSDSGPQLHQRVASFIEFQWFKGENAFANRIDYFDKGILSRSQVMVHERKYAKRWPYRSYRLSPGALRIEQIEGGRIRATFGYTFEVRRRAKRVTGRARSQLILVPHGQSFRATAVREIVDEKN